MMGYERGSVCSVSSGTDEESSFRRQEENTGIGNRWREELRGERVSIHAHLCDIISLEEHC